MANANVRVVTLNAQNDYARRLRGHLLSIPGVKVAAEVSDSAQFVSSAARFRADVIMVDLDPDPAKMLEQVSAIVQNNRECHVLAVSRQEDPRLILSCMRAGVRDFINKPIDHEKLIEAFDKVFAQKSESVNYGKIICVIGSAGGVGTSTIAINLACEFAQISADKVALVDLDYDFGVVSSVLEVPGNFTIMDLCTNADRLEPAVVERALSKHASGVSVLPRPHDLGQAANISVESINAILSTLQETFQYVVVDGPLRYDGGLRQIVEHSDEVLLILNLSLSSVRSADRLMQQLIREGYNTERIKLIVNRVGKESGGILVEHVEQALNRQMSYQIAEDWKTATGSMNVGDPLVTYAPNSKLRLSLKELAGQLQHSAATLVSG